MKLRGNAALKIADRVVGVPMLAALGLLPKRFFPTSVRRFGILRTAAIGDTLLLAGILRDSARTYPSAEILLITGRDNASAGAFVARGSARQVTVSAHNPAAAIRVLRGLRLDVLVDTGTWPRMDALLTALSGAAFRVGFRTPGQYRHFAFDAVAPHDPRLHELENFRVLVREASVKSMSSPELSHHGLPVARDVPSKPFLVFHPWSGGFRGYLKEWPNERWVSLSQRFPGMEVVVTGSNAQAENTHELANALGRFGNKAHTRIGLPFPELAAVLCASRAVVSVNTGVMHLAAQLGVPTVALEGPTPPHRWGPIGPRAVSVTSPLPGCGYLNLGFEYDGQRTDCMEGVSVDSVEEAVRQLVAL